ncbi:putative Transcriptional regulator, TetR family [[Clostridium] ultunense Esp]|uniref:Putative Transcriptional regulator, TetR family n=1 Tax=[Clostridium] ultunense Esp TaxID=1288971 RepID=M1Z0Y6_9FIRM|nr:TetR/AcrR family transcriptional regulator [Schnuerera ultunensis]CCQ96540.1 putative Transcriptional regulator, TetR family [[Clostridium] ultunense Esp]SHD76507.1 putative Transcriptional regulator, TetR family [[Clostridium] ultunense Esp]
MPKQTFFNLPLEKKQRIINATYDLFIKEAYEDVNIRMITSRAEISIGSFYKYFHDKDELYLYLMSEIEKKIYAKEMEKRGYFLMDSNMIPIEDICTPKEIAFNRTWYRVPVEVMMKFYFGEYSRELNSHVMDELKELEESGKLKDFVDIDFAFHIYATSMFNIQMYFRNNNIDNEKERLRIKKDFYSKWFLGGILNEEAS